MIFPSTTRRGFLHRLFAGLSLSAFPFGRAKNQTANAAPLINTGAPGMQTASGNQTSGQVARAYPGGANADIWVFSGQSNSVGWGLLKEPIQPDPRILFFNADNQWVLAEEPLNPRFLTWVPTPVQQNILLQRGGLAFPSGAVLEDFLRQRSTRGAVPLGGVGATLFFAKHLIDYIDRPIGLMHCGVGGSPIKSWNPALKNTPKSNYGTMLERIAMVGGNIKGIIWYQGESDATTPGAADVYEQALLQLVDSVRRDTGIPDLPFICVQIAQFVWPENVHGRNFEKIRDIQRRLPELRKNTYTVSALDLPLEDPAHLSFEAYKRLGPRLAEIALTEVYRQGGHATPISLDSFDIIQPENRRPIIRVRFKGVNGRLRAPGRPMGFELRRDAPSGSNTTDTPLHVIYRVDFDLNDPTGVLLGIADDTLISTGGRRFHSLTVQPFSIVYGPGMSPYVNLVDDKDIPVPAFGPVEVPMDRR